MPITPILVRAFIVHGAPGLNPITVYLQDLPPHHGRIVIECMALSWASYLIRSAKPIEQYMREADTDYLTDYLDSTHGGDRAQEREYLRRIVGAVQAALKAQAAEKEGT